VRPNVGPTLFGARVGETGTTVSVLRAISPPNGQDARNAE
jgi:hypothetical protein